VNVGRAYSNRRDRKNKCSDDQKLLQGQESSGGKMRRNSYVMEIDRRRNCYSCGSFRYLASNYRNRRRIGQGRILEYERIENNG